MDRIEDIGKYWWEKKEKPGAREGQVGRENTGDIRKKRRQ